MRWWEWILDPIPEFNNPDTSWTSLTLGNFHLRFTVNTLAGECWEVGTPIWVVSPGRLSCWDNHHLIFQDITRTRIYQKGLDQKGGEKIGVRTRIVTITSPPSHHVSVSLSHSVSVMSDLLQGITWTLCRTTSVALLDNPSPWPCSSLSSCSSTSRTFLVCVGAVGVWGVIFHLINLNLQEGGDRRQSLTWLLNNLIVWLL